MASNLSVIEWLLVISTLSLGVLIIGLLAIYRVRIDDLRSTIDTQKARIRKLEEYIRDLIARDNEPSPHGDDLPLERNPYLAHEETSNWPVGVAGAVFAIVAGFQVLVVEGLIDRREAVTAEFEELQAASELDRIRMQQRIEELEDKLRERQTEQEQEQEQEIGTRDVAVTLRWNNDADIDLYVVSPLGELINYQNPVSPSAGRLEHDDTSGFGPETIFWPLRTAPKGAYRVGVFHYSGTEADYQVEVSNGPETLEFSGTLQNAGEKKYVGEFLVR